MRTIGHWIVAAAAALLITTGSANHARTDREIEVRTVVEETPYAAEYIFNLKLQFGELNKLQHGKLGTVVREYRKIIEDGVVVEDRLIKTTVIDPEPAIFEMGKPCSRAEPFGIYTRDRVLTFESTAYTPDAGRKNPTYTTYTGTRAEFGVIAVDPKVIPLGTLMYVEGYGFGIAEDIGSAIKGNIIDVCIEGKANAMNWGRRNVSVHLFQNEVRFLPIDHFSDGS